MAREKVNRWCPALLHAGIYAAPFILAGSWRAVVVIGLTHALIDRYRLVRFLLKLKEWRFREYWGYVTDGAHGKPAWMWVWLMIVADNALHLTVNYLALRYVT
jgi:hypothetical protein